MIPTTRALPSDSYPVDFSSVYSPQQPRIHPSLNSDSNYGVANYSSVHQNYQGIQKPVTSHMNATGNFRSLNEVNSTQRMQKNLDQSQSSFLVSPSGTRAPNSSVSYLFDRMYQSSTSGSSVPNDLSKKNFERLEGSHSPTVTGKSFASHVAPLHSCSSQGDLSRMTPKVVQETPKYSDYDNVHSCQSALAVVHKYPEKFPDKNLKFQAVETVSSKNIILPNLPSTSDGQSVGKGSLGSSYSKSMSPLDLDSGIDQDFTESEEPLPCDKRPEQISSLNESKLPYYSNATLPQLQNLKDVQLTVFMRDDASNQSLNMGASKFVNKTFQRPSGDGRTGSMPYRVKNTSLVTVQKPYGPIEATGLNGRSEPVTPLTSFEHKKTSETAEVPEKRSENVDEAGRPPVYDGPRLIPMEQIRDNFDSGSLLRSTAETNDKTNAHRLAKRLHELDGFRKSDVAKHLGKRSDFAQLVRQAYLQLFDFSSMTIDGALRNFLTHLVLSGETQERERILAEFSRRFVECNQHFFGSQDSCHVLVCSIMLLNTDLHGENGRKRMTVHEFVENLSGLNGGADFPKDLLKNIYNSIKNDPIEFVTDEVDENSDLPKDGQASLQSHANPFLDLPDPAKAHEFKTGYLMRKCCLESDGRRTQMGKRGWKKFRASLRDLVLYLHKDEHGFSCGTAFDDTSNAVRIHHSLAMDASDYAKRHDVFRLRVADWSEYLFQASDSRECQAWIDVINEVAAAFSAPPLPGAVGSQMKFQRPLMPSTCTKMPLKDQLEQHEQTLVQIEKDLADHREFCPEKGSRPRVIQDYLEKETYLEFEQRRFKIYCGAIKKLILSNADPNKSLADDGYFQRTKSSQASSRSPKKSTDGNGQSETDGEKRNLSLGMGHTTSVSHCHGLHPAKSVPALLFESRV